MAIAKVPERVVKFLRSRNGTPWCDDCIQRSLKLVNRNQVTQVTSTLEFCQEFAREKEECSHCHGVEYVTHYRS